MSSKPARTSFQAGLTMIELIMFIMIIGVALAGIVGVLNLTTKASADPLRRKQALMIAEGLLEEVQLARFTYCDPTADKAGDEAVNGSADCDVPENWGPEAGGKRPFDNINDYAAAANGAVNAFNNADGKLTDANGEPMNVEGYTASVSITPESIGGIPIANPASADVDVLRIRVEVRYDGESIVLDGYRTRYAPNFL
ncbi:type IV pilus modification PilV family protein [Massilia sp. LjRoot122]|uniref:type IV pilus modification PilV family protein n=1 Tax=Massilia sp. LjRoot122 TaxID=3342257 RepID=UPI003ED0D44C